ncbi:MAG: NDP-sugar synthase, partial [Actinomycetota bacterium]|nr:NDP-sugar synthase [Actinomycetota bacterium]
PPTARSVKAVVLVGGEGTRLRPLTFTVPKQVLPIIEIPMIERVLTSLADHGVTEAVLSLGYRHDSFLSLFPDNAACGVSLGLAIEPEPMGTAGAVRFAARAAGIDECCLVVNGDVLTDLDLNQLIDFHQARGAEGTIALGPVDDPANFGQVSTDEEGRVVAFIEKPGVGGASAAPAAQGALVNAGTYVLEPSAIDRIPEGRAVSIEREVFPAMAADGTLFALGSDAYWADTGTPAQYLQVQFDLLSGRRPGPPVPGAVCDEGQVWTLGSSVIEGDVGGPAFVGQAAFIEQGAQVERSVISSGGRVHEGARVSDSVLAPGAVVRRGAVVERSLVGERAVIGEKAILTDLSIVGIDAEVPPGAVLDNARVPAV